MSSCTKARPRHRLSSKQKKKSDFLVLAIFKTTFQIQLGGPHSSQSAVEAVCFSFWGVIALLIPSLGISDLQMLMLETVDRPITPLLHQLPTPPEQSRAASCTGRTTSYLSVTQQHWSRLERKLKREKNPFILVFNFFIIVVLI